ncbi:MAG: DNA-directed RNA polymerase subunit A' [Nanoarchaeota archaeon]
MDEYIRKKVKALKFSLLSPDLIKKLSVAKIVTPELYDVDGFPVDGGLMDLRLGAIDPGVRCRTDGATMKDCPGYPGMVEFARPVLHIKYIPLVELFLRSFCHHCGKLLLSDEKAATFTPVERAKKARDKKKCPHCNEEQERVRLEKPTSFMLGKRRIFPTEIRELLLKVTDAEIKKVGVNAATCRPEWGILSQLLVPSVNVRPSITLESGERSEDDLTHKLSDIIRANQRLWENLNAGAPEVIVEDLWDLLQYHTTTYFDNSITRIPPARHRSGQPLKTITERIKGKEGRIRKNLAGKRVNFSGRTVVSPDPFLAINEVGVPEDIARVITVSESVTIANLESMRDLIRKGENYPGANYVIRPDGKKKRISNELIEDLCVEIQPGYKIERHLRDGDIVLFNRHPSLHKQSLMAHYVKVLPDRTFRIHPAVAFPYNADFDGDECNIHSPQTEEARAEAMVLLDVKNNIISSKNNTNLVGCITDGITGTYLLSKDTLSKADAEQSLFVSGVTANLKGKEFGGKEVFEHLLPKGANTKITTEFIGSSAIGVEEGELIKAIDKHVSRQEVLEFVRGAFAIGSWHLSRKGYTLSLQDLNVSSKIREMTDKVISDAERKTGEIIQDASSGKLSLLPGKTLEESREVRIAQVLNEVRSEAGKIVKTNFPSDGNVSKMIAAGSAGSLLNITQIGCCVGQQILWDHRINFGYTNRTLSFFERGDLGPAARGFIKSSFIEGLKPTEFFFGAITGRDALMDTALRTPKSGYLYRRLVSALQDLKVEYDETVRDASGNIVQFLYGGDGLDVSGLHLGMKVPPGECVGVVTAQSFGEASTQMVLRTFHSAGVAEMQVTLGLPRLIEIFDARKKPSTPQMNIHLDKEFNNEKDARVVAEKIKEVTLAEVAKEIKVDFGGKKIEVEIDNVSLKTVHVGVSTIADRLKEKGFDCKARESSIVLSVPDLGFKEIYKLKEKVKLAVISGVKGIKQVVVSNRGKDFVIITSGSNLKDVLLIKGVDKDRVSSNDIHETAEVLGIEAARQTIMNEIKKVLEGQGLEINIRHLDLIADAMTSSGVVKGVTRMGIVSDKSSIFARAAFETPDKQFINATIQGRKDELESVIENIMLNQPVPVGTGLPGLLVKVVGSLSGKSSGKKAE